MKVDVNQPCFLCGHDQSELVFETTYPQHRYPGDFVMRRCLGCELLFNSPRLNDEDLLKLYDRNYYFFQRKVSSEFNRITEMYARTIALVEEETAVKKVLEIGSAKGYLLGVLKQKGWEATGIEVSQTAVQFANSRFDLNCYAGTFEDYRTEFPSKRFPLVIAIDLLEHLSHPGEFIAGLAEVVDQDGLLLIDTPNGASYNISVQGSKWIGFNPFHIYLFSVKNLTMLLEQNGFVVEKKFSYGNAVIDRSSAREMLSGLKSHLSLVLHRCYLGPVIHKIRQTSFVSQKPDVYLSRAIEHINQNGDYLKTEDARGELSGEQKGDNIVVIARRKG